jgi:hypothetical protein
MMKSVLRHFASLLVGGVLSAGLAHASDVSDSAHSPLVLATAAYPNGATRNAPDNGAIRRANPNSRQGTQSISPPVRGPATGVNPPSPTLENGGIRNGYPTRQQAPSSSSGSERRSTD